MYFLATEGLGIWGPLIQVLQNLLLPIIIVVVGGLAVMRAIKGRITEVIILIAVVIVALIFFINPTIISSLATNISGQVETALP